MWRVNLKQDTIVHAAWHVRSNIAHASYIRSHNEFHYIHLITQTIHIHMQLLTPLLKSFDIHMLLFILLPVPLLTPIGMHVALLKSFVNDN